MYAAPTTQAAYIRTALIRTHLDLARRHRETTVERLPELAGHDTDAALRIALFDALRQLSDRDRAIVVLRYWEDRSVEETAVAVGLRPGAVRSRCLRSLRRLRTLLGSDATELMQP